MDEKSPKQFTFISKPNNKFLCLSRIGYSFLLVVVYFKLQLPKRLSFKNWPRHQWS